MAVSPGMEEWEERQGHGLSTEIGPALQEAEIHHLPPCRPSGHSTVAVALPAHGVHFPDSLIPG